MGCGSGASSCAQGIVSLPGLGEWENPGGDGQSKDFFIGCDTLLPLVFEMDGPWPLFLPGLGKCLMWASMRGSRDVWLQSCPRLGIAGFPSACIGVLGSSQLLCEVLLFGPEILVSGENTALHP